MSAPQRGGRGRGRGRAGASRSANASEDERPLRAGAARRGRGAVNFTNGVARDISKTLERAAGRQPPRGPRSNTPSTRSNGQHTVAAGASPKQRIVSGSPDERYAKLKKLRERERADAIAKGFLADPDKPRSLADAITMVGTCQDMCPEYERVTRIVQKDEWGPETVTVIGDNRQQIKQIDESRMVKKFRRSAAGLDEQLPSDLRPPPVLLRTVKYLFNDVIDEAGSLAKVHHFIWDRTRAIRNDFSIQQVNKTPDVRMAIECYEHIARFHILSLHQIGGQRSEKTGDRYDWQQDREQLDRTLLSLLQYYDDVQDRYRSANEAEFRAYWIVFQIQNTTADLEDRVQTWPRDTMSHPRVQTALKVYAAASDLMNAKGPFKPRTSLPIAQQDWNRFWRLVASNQVSYLMSCVAEIFFYLIRRTVLNLIFHAYKPGGSAKTEDWTLEELGYVLGFEEEEDTQNFVEHYGFNVGEKTDGTPFLDLTSVQGRALPEPSPGLPDQTFSWNLVERKRHGRSFPAIINGLSVKMAREAGMITEESEAEQNAMEMEESLFVTGDSDEEDTKVKATSNPQLNPSVASFVPAATQESTAFTPRPSTGLGGFGQPSFAQPSFASPVSQPSEAPTQNPFALPVVAKEQSKPSFSFIPPSGATTAPSTTSTTPLFSFTPQANTPATQPMEAVPSQSPFSFAAPLAASTTSWQQESTSKASPFSFTPKPTETQTPPKPKPASFGKVPGGFAFPSLDSNATRTNGVAASKIPEVQITPPQEDTTKAVQQAPSKSPTKPLFQPLSTSRSNAPSEKSVLNGQPSTSSPFFSFQQQPNPTSTISTPSTSATGSSSFAFSSPLDKRKSLASTAPSSSTVATASVTTTTTTTTTTTDSGVFSFSKPTPLESKPQPNIQAASPFPSVAKSATTPPLGQPVQREDSLEKRRENLRKEQALDYVTNQLLLDSKEGFLKQFVEYIAAPIVNQTMKDYEEEKDLRQADEFRWWTLAYRYGPRWRRVTTEMRLRRQGRERRRRIAAEREAHAKRMKEKESAQQTVVEEFDNFRANLEAQRKDFQPALDFGCGLIGQPQEVLEQDQRGQAANSALQPQNEEGASVGDTKRQRVSVRAHKRSKTQPDVLTPNNANHRVSKQAREPSPTPSIKSDRSSLLGASMLSGASILEARGLPIGTKMSTMKSNYFTLKAMGLLPPLDHGNYSSGRTSKKRTRGSDEYFLGNGSLVSNSPPERKRRFSTIDQPSFSSPVANNASQLRTGAFHESPKDPSPSSQSKRTHPVDEALFARLRSVMHAMDESTSFYKEEIEKDELRQSQMSTSTHGSPFHAQHNGSPPNNLPKFYSRASRFLPREEYGKRRETKASADLGKGKAKAEDASPFQPNGLVNGAGSRSTNMPPPPQPRRTPRTSKPSNPNPGNSGPPKSGASFDDAIEL